MKLLESAPIVKKFLLEFRKESADLIDRGVTPHLAVVLIGDDPDSLRYIDIKTKRAKECGITVSLYHMEDTTPEQDIFNVLDFLSADDEVHGIIVQLPVPGFNEPKKMEELLSHIAVQKDVDGLRGEWKKQHYSGTSLVALRAGFEYALPPMVAAVCILLDHYKISLADKNIVIVGKGVLVGQPLEFFLKDSQKLQVTTVDEKTDKILEITTAADILITGTGNKDLITYQWVKPGAVVLDCAADVHRDSVDQIVQAVAPATGGLGPLTVTWLLFNTLRAAVNQSK